MFQFFKHYFPSILFLGLIGYLSLASFQSSSLPSKIPYFDKIVHFGMYFILSFVLSIDTCRHFDQAKMCRRFAIFIFLLATLTGVLMEILQGTMTSYRSADWHDALANSFGAAVGVCVAWNIAPKIVKFFSKRHLKG